MYNVMIAGLMFILPIASIIAEMTTPGASLIILIGKWFVFWAVGLRLLTAGIKQLVQPGFTAKTIFEIEDPAAGKIVSELGISNLAMGVIGLLSLYFQNWVMPVAIYGVIFYGLAAVRHLGNKTRNATENVATISDAWVAIVLAVYLIGAVGFR
ncbi:MAG TPA: DUF6790 family protein [Devosiaceae bacterium]